LSHQFGSISRSTNHHRPRNITLHTLLIERVMRVIRHREEEIDPSWGRAMRRHRASGPRLDFALTPSLSPGHFGAGLAAVKQVGLL
jgi:hypothetical protein